MDKGVSSSDDRAVVNEADKSSSPQAASIPDAVDAQYHSFREWPEDPEGAADLFREMARIQSENGARWFRYTYVNDEYPHMSYPHGLYVEGWATRPEREPPFSFPMTAQGIEARQGGDGTAPSSDESPVSEADAPQSTQEEPTHDQ